MGISIIILLAGIVLGYDVLCPDRSQKQLRSRGLCVENSTYTCLEDVNTHKFIESCLEKKDAVRPGKRYVLKGQSTTGECSILRYQPIKFKKASGSECIYLKSTCTEVGQVVRNNGTGLDDKTCICDYTEGYAYVTRPADVCNCVPSKEDCTCYKVICPQLYHLSADNTCIYRKTANMTECATVYKSGKDAKTTMRTDSTALNNSSVRKQIRTEEPYITWRIVFTVIIPVILLVIVVLLITEQEAILPEDASEDVFQSAMSSPSTPQSPSLFSQDETTTNTAVVLEPEVIIISKPLQEKNTEIQEKKRVATSLSDVKSNRKRKTPADVNELQCMFLKKEMIKQDKEIIKLDLQIKLLQQLLDRTPTSPTYSQLLSAMF